jgi:hypothetical protein
LQDVHEDRDDHDEMLHEMRRGRRCVVVVVTGGAAVGRQPQVLMGLMDGVAPATEPIDSPPPSS